MNEFQLDSPCAFVIVNEALKLNKKTGKKNKEKTHKSYTQVSQIYCVVIEPIEVFNFDAILRESDQKLQCLYGNPMAKFFFPKLNFTQFVNRNVIIVRRRLYFPIFKDVAWLEDVQLIFLIFHAFVCNFFPARSVYPVKFRDKCMEN